MFTTNQIENLYITREEHKYTDEIYEFLKNIPDRESGFINPFRNLSEEQFKEIGINIIRNMNYLSFTTPNQKSISTFFLWLDNKVIGMYHVLHELTEEIRNTDGHIAYTIRKEYRKKGYATKGLALVLEEAKKIVVEDEILMHTTKDNIASLKVQLNNGATIYKETDTDYFTKIKIK